jgi:hypothetical protein
VSLAENVAIRVAPPLRRLIEQRDALLAENKALRSELPRHGDESRLSYLFNVTYGAVGIDPAARDCSTPARLPDPRRERRHHGVAPHHVAGDEAQAGPDRHAGACLRAHARLLRHGRYSSKRAADSFRRHMLDVVLRPSKTTRVTGFTEIRWWRHKDLGEFLEFMELVFPGARFIPTPATTPTS